MHPLDIGSLVTLGDTAVSPDGTRIAFTVRRVDLEGNRYRSAVWLAAVDGDSAPYQLTAGEHGDARRSGHRTGRGWRSPPVAARASRARRCGSCRSGCRARRSRCASG